MAYCGQIGQGESLHHLQRPVNLLALRRALIELGIDDARALWILRDANAISDHCECIEDIAAADCEKAVKTLRNHKHVAINMQSEK